MSKNSKKRWKAEGKGAIVYIPHDCRPPGMMYPAERGERVKYDDYPIGTVWECRGYNGAVICRTRWVKKDDWRWGVKEYGKYSPLPAPGVPIEKEPDGSA